MWRGGGRWSWSQDVVRPLKHLMMLQCTGNNMSWKVDVEARTNLSPLSADLAPLDTVMSQVPALSVPQELIVILMGET